MKDVSFLQHKINNAGSFLQTINVIIIAKQPVLIQLKVVVITTKIQFHAPRATEQDLSFRQLSTCSDPFDIIIRVDRFSVLVLGAGHVLHAVNIHVVKVGRLWHI